MGIPPVEQEVIMSDIPNSDDIIVSHSNQDNTLDESASDLGAIIIEIDRERQHFGEHTKRMAELKRLATLQKNVILRMLESSVEERDKPKRPHLKVIK